MLPDIDSFYTEVGHRIKNERIKKNVSQKNLGNHLELTRASIINLEKGRHRPSIYQLIQIASFFQVDYTTFIPYEIQKSRRRKVDLSKELNDNNIVTDQQKIGRSTRTVINNFLSSIQKK